MYMLVISHKKSTVRGHESFQNGNHYFNQFNAYHQFAVSSFGCSAWDTNYRPWKLTNLATSDPSSHITYIYLTKLAASMTSSHKWTKKKNTIKGVWKDVAMAQFKIFSLHFPGGPEMFKKTFTLSSLCPSWDSNWTPHERTANQLTCWMSHHWGKWEERPYSHHAKRLVQMVGMTTLGIFPFRLLLYSPPTPCPI